MRIDYAGTSLSFPDFLIVGASRSGTSALYTYLSRHPRIYMPLEKEPMFFCRWNRPPLSDMRRPGGHLDWVVSDLEDYVALFQPAREDQLLGEGSTWYLYEHDRVIANLQKLYGERHRALKIIILLRDPVARSWSQYVYHVSERRRTRHFPMPAVRTSSVSAGRGIIPRAMIILDSAATMHRLKIIWITLIGSKS